MGGSNSSHKKEKNIKKKLATCKIVFKSKKSTQMEK